MLSSLGEGKHGRPRLKSLPPALGAQLQTTGREQLTEHLPENGVVWNG
jgi:hypothetical protein